MAQDNKKSLDFCIGQRGFVHILGGADQGFAGHDLGNKSLLGFRNNDFFFSFIRFLSLPSWVTSLQMTDCSCRGFDVFTIG